MSAGPRAGYNLNHGWRPKILDQEALEQLGERERIIIQRRRLTDEGVTLESLGHDFGVSKERVRQLEHRAMQKLKPLWRPKLQAR